MNVFRQFKHNPLKCIELKMNNLKKMKLKKTILSFKA